MSVYFNLREYFGDDMYKIIDIFSNNKIFQSFVLFRLLANNHHLRSSLFGRYQVRRDSRLGILTNIRKEGGEGRGVVLFSCA